MVERSRVTPEYFQLVGIPLRRGRLFNEFDSDTAPPVAIVNVPALEGLQVQPDRRHGSLQLVGHGIDERVVLFVAPDLADQECRVEHQAKDQDHKEYDPENQQHDFTQVENYPTDVEGDRESYERSSQCNEEDYRLSTTAADAHGTIVR